MTEPSFLSQLLGYLAIAGFLFIAYGVGGLVERREAQRRARRLRLRVLDSLDHSRRWTPR